MAPRGAEYYVRGVDLQALAHAYRERARRERERAERRRAELRERCRNVARMLVEEFGATEVWLFGSLAWGRLHAASDVDLAVRGVPDDRFYTALARAWAMLETPVDLVPLDACPSELATRIRREGVRLDA